ncbi:MAG: site-2 protease family protein [Bacteroidaceae bacterium]|nr:site-2 protease family protein [Bacteroidaceae bacterium]MBR6122766.1 site-2 protease family protein [Candidatus Saccharibacteria bacterium]
MMLHELVHGGMAYLLGDETAKEDGRLTLNPLKHLDPFMSVILPLISYLLGGVVFGGAKPVPVNPHRLKGREWGMAAVAIAGPLTNFVLAFVSFLILELTSVNAGSGLAYTILIEMVFVNLGFGVFNLIPIPPLDGSRVLYVLMPDGVREFMDKMEKFGIYIIYILILVGGGVFSSVMTGAIQGIIDGFYWIIGK